MIKVVKIIVIGICISLLISPWVALLLPEKLAQHAYYRYFYNLIAAKETSGCSTQEEKALRILDYVHKHEFPQGSPYKCKPMDSLITGEAYCDFQARTLNALLGVSYIKSRYAMLFDKNMVSPHTLNEVFLYGKWCVFGPLNGIAYRDESGNLLTLEDLSKKPELLYTDKKMSLFREYGKEKFDYVVKGFTRVFPMPVEPKRSTPVVYQAHPLDYMVDLYYRMFGNKLFYLYQDVYLKLKKNILAPADRGLLYFARSYHLAYRYNLALKCYEDILSKYPDSEYRQDTLFFCGMLYFETGKYEKAIAMLKELLNKYPLKWKNAGSCYLGLSYDAIGNIPEAVKAYNNCEIYQLTPEMLSKLIEFKR